MEFGENITGAAFSLISKREMKNKVNANSRLKSKILVFFSKYSLNIQCEYLLNIHSIFVGFAWFWSLLRWIFTKYSLNIQCEYSLNIQWIFATNIHFCSEKIFTFIHRVNRRSWYTFYEENIHFYSHKIFTEYSPNIQWIFTLNIQWTFASKVTKREILVHFFQNGIKLKYYQYDVFHE